MDGGTSESTGGGRGTIVEGLGSLEGWWNASGIALWSFVLFGAFLLNATLLLAFLKRPGLRTISNRFVMNLTVSNLLTCAILNPLLMLDAPSSSSTMRTTCAIAESATSLVTSSSVLSVLLIAIDQYLAVVDPLRYRTRIDKLKCGILVVSIWLVSLTFAILAGFNPAPRSLWLVCTSREEVSLYAGTNETSNEALNFTLDPSLSLLVEATENYALDENSTLTELSRSLHLDDNETVLSEKRTTFDDAVTSGVNVTVLTSYNLTITYGLIYTVAYALLAYLAPFAGVCWIYVRIYSAAHKNSERTRRTGSRPILSSASFSEEYCPVRQEASSEDFRRIPKISSLSSIDESIETHTPSQTIMPRRCSEYSSNVSTYNHEATNETIDEEEQQQANVVFTVGSSKVNVKSQQERSSTNGDETTGASDETKDTINENKVPIAILKAQFLDRDETTNSGDNSLCARSKFRDEPRQKRKSSHDLMYERMLRGDLDKLSLASPDDNDSTSTDDEDYEEDGDNEDDRETRDREPSNNEDASIDRPDVESEETRASTRKNDKEDRATSTKNDARDENRDVSATTVDEPDDTRDSPPANDEPSSRKSSLDYSVTNQASQSSILKPQNGTFLGKFGNRYSTNFHRNEQLQQPANNSDDVYGKCLSGHLEPSAFGASSTSTPIVTITPPNKSCLQRVSSVRSTSSYINSLKHRISNGSLFKYREETRAARISALVIVMGLICWTPYVIVLILKNISSITGKRISHESDVAAVSFMILATYVSPLLFGYRSRRVKRELRKFFCFRRELSYKNNRSLMAKKVLKRRHSGNMSQLEMDARYNIFNCVYGRTRWPKDKVHFVQVPETALVVETCRSSFSSGASTQISSTSTEEC